MAVNVDEDNKIDAGDENACYTDGDFITNNGGNPKIHMPITYYPAKYGQIQISISLVRHSPAKSEIINVFDNNNAFPYSYQK